MAVVQEGEKMMRLVESCKSLCDSCEGESKLLHLVKPHSPCELSDDQLPFCLPALRISLDWGRIKEDYVCMRSRTPQRSGTATEEEGSWWCRCRKARMDRESVSASRSREIEEPDAASAAKRPSFLQLEGRLENGSREARRLECGKQRGEGDRTSNVRIAVSRTKKITTTASDRRALGRAS